MKNILNLAFGRPSTTWLDLPFLIKLFSIYFFISGIIVFLLSGCQLFLANFTISMYGLVSKTPASILGIIVLFLYLSKFYISIGFFRGLKQIYKIALIDCVAGIIICLFVLLEPIFLDKLIIPNKIASELFFLFPYLVFIVSKMSKKREVLNLGQAH